MSQPTFTATYQLNTPDGTPQTAAQPGYKAYYDALRATIDDIKTVTGQELTVWRDAVGNREQGKEAGTKQAVDEDGEDEDDGAQE
ncbi:hypothetical protein BC834DRAFT_965285 [Gloeopeniophorella convolvens]|nr:hypothetical protein BC834DRAFT_965285 [Gloeopeniophorella convolvens]